MSKFIKCNFALHDTNKNLMYPNPKDKLLNGTKYPALEQSLHSRIRHSLSRSSGVGVAWTGPPPDSAHS